jgi:hypothetical protein
MTLARQKPLTAENAEAAEKKKNGSAISAHYAVRSFWQWRLDVVSPAP